MIVQYCTFIRGQVYLSPENQGRLTGSVLPTIAPRWSLINLFQLDREETGLCMVYSVVKQIVEYEQIIFSVFQVIIDMKANHSCDFINSFQCCEINCLLKCNYSLCYFTQQMLFLLFYTTTTHLRPSSLFIVALTREVVVSSFTKPKVRSEETKHSIVLHSPFFCFV